MTNMSLKIGDARMSTSRCSLYSVFSTFSFVCQRCCYLLCRNIMATYPEYVSSEGEIVSVMAGHGTTVIADSELFSARPSKPYHHHPSFYSESVTVGERRVHNATKQQRDGSDTWVRRGNAANI